MVDNICYKFALRFAIRAFGERLKRHHLTAPFVLVHSETPIHRLALGRAEAVTHPLCRMQLPYRTELSNLVSD